MVQDGPGKQAGDRRQTTLVLRRGCRCLGLALLRLLHYGGPLPLHAQYP